MSAVDKINSDKDRLAQAILKEFEGELTEEEVKEVTGGLYAVSPDLIGSLGGGMKAKSWPF